MSHHHEARRIPSWIDQTWWLNKIEIDQHPYIDDSQSRCSKPLTITGLELVISGRWYLLIIDVGTICGFKIDNERSVDRDLYVNMPGRSIQEGTNFTTPLEPPNSSFSCTCRSNIAIWEHGDVQQWMASHIVWQHVALNTTGDLLICRPRSYLVRLDTRFGDVYVTILEDIQK